MALKSDDFDIRKSWLRCHWGGNGDPYIVIYTEDEKGIISSSSVRIATSGGNADTEIKVAAVNLTIAMHRHDTHPTEQDN